MTPMPSFEMNEMAPDQAAHAAQMSATAFSIKRTGMRPLRFEGTELCMAMSFVPGAPYWYEINIYRTTAQGFVVAVRQFFTSENERDRVRAWECESFEDVLDRLEGYDAGRDVRVDRFPDDDKTPVGHLAAEAFALRAKVAAAREQYGGLLGEILDELEQAG